MTEPRANTLRRTASSFAKRSDAVVAVELALVGLPFFMILIGIIVVGLMLYCQTSLDYAVRKASRQIMIGATQASGQTASQFNTQTFCPMLPGLFDCTKIMVVLKTLPVTAQNYNWGNYHQFVAWDNSALLIPSQSSFCPGGSSDYEVLEVTYPFPVLLSYFSASSSLVNGKFLMMSTAAFRNEPFPASATQYVGC